MDAARFMLDLMLAALAFAVKKTIRVIRRDRPKPLDAR